MSEVSRAVINMPYELAMSSELSRRQFHGIAQSMQSDHDKRVAELEAELAEAVQLLNKAHTHLTWSRVCSEESTKGDAMLICETIEQFLARHGDPS